MKHLKRIVFTAIAAISLTVAGTIPANAATYTGWYSQQMTHWTSIGSCPVAITPWSLSGQHYGSITETSSCAGNTGVRTKHKFSTTGPTYVNSTVWGSSYARQNVVVLVSAQGVR